MSISRRNSIRPFGISLALLLLQSSSLNVVLAAPSDASGTPPAASQVYSAEEVKAAYLANFIRFTKWPESAFESAASPYVIGVIGNRELEDELVALSDRQSIHERRLRIVRVRSTRELASCHLVFFESAIPTSDAPELTLKECLSAVRERPVLTVSNSPEFIAGGGIINLYRERDNLRFEIAPAHAKSSGLTLSSRLLALARIVARP